MEYLKCPDCGGHLILQVTHTHQHKVTADGRFIVGGKSELLMQEQLICPKCNRTLEKEKEWFRDGNEQIQLVANPEVEIIPVNYTVCPDCGLPIELEVCKRTVFKVSKGGRCIAGSTHSVEICESLHCRKCRRDFNAWSKNPSTGTVILDEGS